MSSPTPAVSKRSHCYVSDLLSPEVTPTAAGLAEALRKTKKGSAVDPSLNDVGWVASKTYQCVTLRGPQFAQGFADGAKVLFDQLLVEIETITNTEPPSDYPAARNFALSASELLLNLDQCPDRMTVIAKEIVGELGNKLTQTWKGLLDRAQVLASVEHPAVGADLRVLLKTIRTLRNIEDWILKELVAGRSLRDQVPGRQLPFVGESFPSHS